MTEDNKKKDKTISDLKKTQRCNENRIQELREQLGKAQEKNEHYEVQLHIVSESQNNGNNKNQIEQPSEICSYYLRGGCKFAERCNILKIKDTLPKIITSVAMVCLSV